MTILSGCSSQVVIGEKVNSFSHFTDSNTLLMVSPSQLVDGYQFTENDVVFTLGVENDQVVYQSTRDMNFVTDELKCGDHLPEYYLDRVVREDGWGCYVLLDSGWNAAFYCGNGQKGSGKVEWFFKRV